MHCTKKLNIECRNCYTCLKVEKKNCLYKCHKCGHEEELKVLKL